MNEKQRHIWQIIFEMFTDYYIFVLFFLSFFILNYLKFATSEWFDQISDRIDNFQKQKKVNLESIIKEIGQMAGINRMILSILSPLLLIFAASSIIDLIVLFMWFQNYDLNFLRNLLSTLTTWFYLGYIIYLTENSLQKFQQITRKFIDNNLFRCCGYCQSNNQMKYSKNASFQFCQQKQRLIECYRLYRQDFQMYLFYICPFDLHFILDSFLFTLIFVIISIRPPQFNRFSFIDSEMIQYRFHCFDVMQMCNDDTDNDN
ncbi:hypothetical protein DERP_009801 [Dermatophagoides pteronyssinus]|uniref:Uncharacterized protein n=1 Tax=Dermatophagoides pteronyssinus TaxID=6956 RepID=A0ABQ8IR75_DERPT|nr:hypothetical protein DERP_009801 [Dermatophagoides pteronyssinus]